MKIDAKVFQILNDFHKINFVNILIIIVTAILLLYVIKRIVPWIAERLPSRFRIYILSSAPILRFIVLVLAFILIIPEIINPSLQNIVAILGAAGLVLGFAFKDFFSSLIAGVVVIYERPYQQGDWVRIDNSYGEVKSMELRSLRLLTPDDTLVTIPHKKIWDNT